MRRRILLVSVAFLGVVLVVLLGKAVVAAALMPVLQEADDSAACTVVQRTVRGGDGCTVEHVALNEEHVAVYRFLRPDQRCTESHVLTDAERAENHIRRQATVQDGRCVLRTNVSDACWNDYQETNRSDPDTWKAFQTTACGAAVRQTLR